MTTPWRPTLLATVQAQPRTPGEARRALLRERGVSLSDIARGLERHLSVISRVNNGRRRSRAIEGEIARRLSLPLADAFPEWYEPAFGGRPASFD